MSEFDGSPPEKPEGATEASSETTVVESVPQQPPVAPAEVAAPVTQVPPAPAEPSAPVTQAAPAPAEPATSQAAASSTPLEKESIVSETTYDGRYIPYGGGFMGWFENSGVLACETGNAYKFHTMVDVDAVRAKLFERWGDTDSINRRAVKRTRVDDLRIKTTIVLNQEELMATTIDFSSHGLQLQLIQEEVPLKKGDMVRTKLFGDTERRDEVFDVEARIMWVTRTGRRRPIWQIGTSFVNVSFEETQKLGEYFGK